MRQSLIFFNRFSGAHGDGGGVPEGGGGREHSRQVGLKHQSTHEFPHCFYQRRSRHI